MVRKKKEDSETKKKKPTNYQKLANIVAVLGFALSLYLAMTLQILPALNKEEIVISLPVSCTPDPKTAELIEFPISNNLGYDVSFTSSVDIYPETYSINDRIIPNKGILYHNQENVPNFIGYNITFNNKGNYEVILTIQYGKSLSLSKTILCNVS